MLLGDQQCPICSQNTREISHQYFFNGTIYKLHKCELCGLEFWYPRHIDKKVYEDSYEGFYDSFHDGTNKLASWCKWFLNSYSQSGKNKNLLDVGCGSGEFLHSISPNGFALYGVDIDIKSTLIAKTKVNGSIYNNSLAGIRIGNILNGGSFDVITGFEVLEHQDNPRLFLKDINYFLKPNGYFFGSVPNRNRLFAGIDRFATKGDLPPHHFLWWDSKSLQYALQSNGFTNVRIRVAERLSIINLIGLLQDILIPKRKTRKLKETIIQQNFLSNLFINSLKNIRNFLFLPIVLPIYILQYIFFDKKKELYFSAQKLNH